jgi:hypothetical protein
MDSRRELSILMGGFATSQMLYVAARLKLADHLASGPRSVAELAAESGARMAPLRRVIRSLAAFGVFKLDGDGCVANTPLSECLRSGADDSLRDQALVYGEESYHAMSELLQAVRSGGTAFEHAYRKPHFSYLATNPEAANAFYATSAAASAGAARALVKAYDFSDVNSVVDVGGGTGSLLRAVLRANPHATGVLIETAGLARKAKARIHADGLTERCDVETGDTAEQVPRGADVYLLGHVLHGLDDAHAIRVLSACARAMSDEARLLIVERLIPEADALLSDAQFAAVSDTLALAVSGGMERTRGEVDALLSAAGLERKGDVRLASSDSLVVAARRR